jgi:hypothetical protein
MNFSKNEGIRPPFKIIGKVELVRRRREAFYSWLGYPKG